MSAGPILIPSLESIPDFVGRALGPSDWVTVSQEQIDAFAEVSGDHQWIHCDVERASRESPWKTTIAPGYLTLSLAPHLLAEIMTLHGWSTCVNSGIDRLRFSAPVPSGSRVRMSAEIKSARKLSRGGVRVAIGIRFEAEGAPKPALTATVNYVYLP